MPPQLFALDFGTTNAWLAQWQPETQSARLLHLPELSQPDGMMPSLVCVYSHIAQSQSRARYRARD